MVGDKRSKMVGDKRGKMVGDKRSKMVGHTPRNQLLFRKGWFTIRRKACVRCAVHVVMKRNVSMASSEIYAKTMQRYSVAQLNLDPPVDSTH